MYTVEQIAFRTMSRP